VQILSAGTDIGFDCPYFGTMTQEPYAHCAVVTTGTGSLAGTGISAGTINYATGAFSITFTTAPASGVALTANLMANGWSYGTGLLDEDGRHTGWLGATSLCLIIPVGSTEGTTSYACRTGNPGGYKNPATAPAVNQNFATDAYSVMQNYYAEYFDVTRTAVKTAKPNSLYFSGAAFGNYGLPPPSFIAQAAYGFVDVPWVDMQPQSVSSASAMFAYTTSAFPGPLFNLVYITAGGDSAASNGSAGEAEPVGVTTQAQRGQAYYNYQNYQLYQAPGSDGNFHFIGMSAWGMSADCNTDTGHNNWGATSCGGATSLNNAVTNNAYNGIEAAVGAVACSAPNATLACGNEPTPPSNGGTRPFGNGLTGINSYTTANALWYTPQASFPCTKCLVKLEEQYDNEGNNPFDSTSVGLIRNDRHEGAEGRP
jgi:hypothetical protein